MILWVSHASKVNALWPNPVTMQGNLSWYFFNSEAFSIASLTKLATRLIVYVLGPGTLVAIVYALMKDLKGIKTRAKKHRRTIILLLSGAGLYLGTFMNLNVHHNYYQLPTVLPLYLVLLILGMSVFNTKQGALVLSLAILANVVTAQALLARQDKEFAKLTSDLKSTIASGGHLPEIELFTNFDCSPMLSYYLGRYLQAVAIKILPRTKGVLKSDWLIVCSQKPAAGDISKEACIAIAQEIVPICNTASRNYGDLWTCTMR